jgi:hypothetical protein
MFRTYSVIRMTASLFLLCLMLASIPAPVSKAQQTDVPPNAIPEPSLTVDQVVANLEEKNRERAAELQGFQGTRTYRLEYRGALGSRDAEMTVSLTFTSPDEKEFTVVSQSGSRFIVDHILKRLLLEEKEASNGENRQRIALSSRNYDFTLAGLEGPPESSEYVLNVIPKTDYKYLYRGRIWVDAKEFAVTRIEAQPAKSPSFWVKNSEITQKYQKVGGLWLPLENRTDSLIRLGGHALLLIQYGGYNLTQATPFEPAETASAGVAVPSQPRETSR